MIVANRSLKIIELLQQAYPDAGPMLNYNSTFELLVAVVLSAQSTDEQVNRVTADLFVDANTPADFAAMDIGELEERIKGVGIYKNKAKNIRQLSTILLEKYGGKVPEDFAQLLELPGIGRKSANVIMAVGFNRPGLGVDTHVQRVVNRIGLVEEKHPEKTEKALKAILPEEIWSISHHLFIFHGRKVCKARRPACQDCCIEPYCQKVIL
ncbi:Endonuclease III [Syntrophomonas zehnderi OL-4]|uniref:Endonuclease III n=1 Tax=Syntrophomonas zehnderi OL-4 TaxID=690567 RepID=A0A0E3W380_9FIRM|nr:Endonuclease III [Syntrophomonas zehnderi OL-4]